MINQPQTIGLAEAIAQIGEGIESVHAGAQMPEPAPPAAPNDAIALTVMLKAGAQASLAEAAVTFGARPASDAAQVAGAVAPAAAAQVQTLVAGLLRDLATAPNGGVYADPAVARGVNALVAGALLPGGPAIIPAPLAALATILRAMALTGDGAALAALSTQLRDVLTSDAATIATALARPSEPAAGANTGSAIIIPLFDPSARTPAGIQPRKPASHAGADLDARSGMPLVPVPQREPDGRRYSDAARRRLAQLGTDPRRGFASEAETAYAAEERWGVRFARAARGEHDFVDSAGRAWNVVNPRSAEHLAATLIAFAAGAGVLVTSATAQPAQRAEIASAVRRCARTAAHPIVIVDGDTEDAWPGS